jgi:hypothetical protein
MIQANINNSNNITFGVGTKDACWNGSTWNHKETQCTWSNGGSYYELGSTHGESLGTVQTGGKIVLTVNLIGNSPTVSWTSNNISFSRPIHSSISNKTLYMFITMYYPDKVSLTVI